MSNNVDAIPRRVNFLLAEDRYPKDWQDHRCLFG
jgi:hypothetical protein